MSMRKILGWGVPLLLLGLLGPGCGHNWEPEYNALQAEHERTQAELQRAQARITELESQNAELRGVLESQGRDLSDMGSLRDGLQRELADARARELANRARLESMRRMAMAFREMVAAGQLRVRIVRGNMVVELPEGILFDSGRADLREAANSTLEQVATVLASVPNRNFLVAGHTDNVPISRRNRYDSNWELSAARGVAVVRFLADHGLSAERLAAAGYADTQPVSSNSDDEGRAQNRRIEIIVLPNLDELPDLSGLENEIGGS